MKPEHGATRTRYMAPLQHGNEATDGSLRGCRLLIPRRPDRPGRAALRVAEAVAEAAEEVDDGLDPRQEHEHGGQHPAGHRHDRHRLHGLCLPLISPMR